MPFSSDGDAIDFIYGVINWKRVGADAEEGPLAADMPVVEFAGWDEVHEPELEPEPLEPAPIFEPQVIADEDEALDLTETAASIPIAEERLPEMPETAPEPRRPSDTVILATS